MEKLIISQVIEAVEGSCKTKDKDIEITNVCTDSRRVQNGDLFIAIEGENFDGHSYIEEAIKKGAAAIIASKKCQGDDIFPIVYVESTLVALGKLAQYYREKLEKPVVAVTGSVGKTSTKELVSTVLASRLNVHKTYNNFNNEIGLPLTIFETSKNHDVVVLEMGMWAEGEIRYLTNIAKPSIAIITNIGVSHIERLGSKENILKAKLEIVEGLREDGLLLLNANDKMLRELGNILDRRVLYVGIDIDADYKAYDIVDNGELGVSFKINIGDAIYDVKLSAIGRHNVSNALFGIACAVELGISPEDFIPSLCVENVIEKRLNVSERDGIKFIDDSYNASPDSMMTSLNVLKSFKDEGRKIAILGNMFELGEIASEEHFKIGAFCGELGIDFVAILGENGADISRGIDNSCENKIFKSHEEIVSFMKGFLKPSDVVLLKGSRGMTMEKILELW